ncbi:hypothetical protein K8R33_02835 [archaeon]|nr:hypothetical protein [archaeon]
MRCKAIVRSGRQCVNDAFPFSEFCGCHLSNTKRSLKVKEQSDTPSPLLPLENKK